jgi:DNA-directed RNA polymerase specialized sigma24 family protein
MDVTHNDPNVSDESLDVPSGLESSSGRSDAFANFYRCELSGQVRRATVLIGDPHLARDLVHDAFVEVYSRWDRLREPGPYLQTAVLNRCRDQARRTQRWSRPRPVLPAYPAPSDDGLWDALLTLPFNHRAALVLRYHNQLSNEEIAATLGCPVGSVGPWIQRGLRRLRKDIS